MFPTKDLIHSMVFPLGGKLVPAREFVPPVANGFPSKVSRSFEVELPGRPGVPMYFQFDHSGGVDARRVWLNLGVFVKQSDQYFPANVQIIYIAEANPPLRPRYMVDSGFYIRPLTRIPCDVALRADFRSFRLSLRWGTAARQRAADLAKDGPICPCTPGVYTFPIISYLPSPSPPGRPRDRPVAGVSVPVSSRSRSRAPPAACVSSSSTMVAAVDVPSSLLGSDTENASAPGAEASRSVSGAPVPLGGSSSRVRCGRPPEFVVATPTRSSSIVASAGPRASVLAGEVPAVSVVGASLGTSSVRSGAGVLADQLPISDASESNVAAPVVPDGRRRGENWSQKITDLQARLTQAGREPTDFERELLRRWAKNERNFVSRAVKRASELNVSGLHPLTPYYPPGGMFAPTDVGFSGMGGRFSHSLRFPTHEAARESVLGSRWPKRARYFEDPFAPGHPGLDSGSWFERQLQACYEAETAYAASLARSAETILAGHEMAMAAARNFHSVLLDIVHHRERADASMASADECNSIGGDADEDTFKRG